MTVIVKGRITSHPSLVAYEEPISDHTIAITGSIFADAEDATKMGAFHTTSIMSDFRGDTASYLDAWRRSRHRLLNMADWIFPAYGGPFKVSFEFF